MRHGTNHCCCIVGTVRFTQPQGMLGIGAVMLGSSYVCGVDVDTDALAQACTNAAQFDDVPECMDWLLADVRQLAVGARTGCVGRCTPLSSTPHQRRRCMLPRCDTVVMNPPFGTKSKGADMDFLCVALATAGHSVRAHSQCCTTHCCIYPFISNRCIHCTRVAQGSTSNVWLAVSMVQYPPRCWQSCATTCPPPTTFTSAMMISNSMCSLHCQGHRQKSKDIEVDLWRFEVAPR